MTNPETAASLCPHIARMRAAGPIHFDHNRNTWEIYDYRDIQAVLADSDAFSSELYRAMGLPELESMWMMDPPRHTKIRKVIAGAFTASMVAKQAPYIHELTNDLLDAVIERGDLDIVNEFSFPLSVAVIANMLGVPRSDQDNFATWAVGTIGAATATMQKRSPEARHLRAVDELNQYLQVIVEDRKHDPRGDLISALIDGDSLTTQEVCNTGRLLLMTGFETTSILIGNAIHLLMEHAESLAQLRADPTLLDNTIEEVLRFAAPAQHFARVASRDVMLGGHTIKEGQWVIVFNAAGNRDESVFPDPDRFDIKRPPHRHLSFGHGIHFCVGTQLARLEARIGIDALLTRMPDLRPHPDRASERIPSQVQCGFSSLPVQFTPSARSHASTSTQQGAAR